MRHIRVPKGCCAPLTLTLGKSLAGAAAAPAVAAAPADAALAHPPVLCSPPSLPWGPSAPLCCGPAVICLPIAVLSSLDPPLSLALPVQPSASA